jgi:hypothetical protein
LARRDVEGVIVPGALLDLDLLKMLPLLENEELAKLPALSLIPARSKECRLLCRLPAAPSSGKASPGRGGGIGNPSWVKRLGAFALVGIITNLSSSTISVLLQEQLSGMLPDPRIGVPGDPNDDPERVFLNWGVLGFDLAFDGEPGKKDWVRMP